MNKPTFIDMFSGCGGLSAGFEQAGFRVVGGTDSNDDAMATFSKMHANSEAWKMPARDFVDSLGSLGLAKGDVDVVAGGPPCQGFCAINPTRNIDDPRNECVTIFLDAIKLLRPAVVVMENVPGLISLAKGRAIRTVLGSLKENGYLTNHMVLQAAHYGSPQNRWRLFVVGTRKNEFDFPYPTHHASIKPNVAGGKALTFRLPSREDLFTRLLPPLTVGDAISDLHTIRNGGGKATTSYKKSPETTFQKNSRKGCKTLYNHQAFKLGPTYMERVKALPKQGMCWLDLPPHLIPANIKRSQEKWGRNSPTRFGRLKTDGFFTSILTKPEPYWGSFIHPTQNRVISVREAARAQNFPDKFNFQGDIASQYRQVGNAVPVILARTVADAVLSHLCSSST